MNRPSHIDWKSITRSIAGIGGAAAAGQLLTFMASPVVSRLFDQEAFGRFGLFFSLANVLAILATLGLQDAIFAARQESHARILFQAALRLLLIFSPLLGLSAYVLIHFNILGYGALPGWAAPLLALEVAIISATAVFQVWLVQGKRFRPLAASYLIQGGARPGTQIAAGFGHFGFSGLIGAELASRATVLGTLLWAGWSDLRTTFGTVTRENCVTIAREYRSFLFFRTPSALLFNFGTALPPALITAAYGVSPAGLYTFMFSVIVAPIAFAQKAIGDVFLGHFAALFKTDPRQAQRFLQRILCGLFAGSTLPAALLWFQGADLFALVFGEPWRESGRLAGIIAPLFMCDLAIGPVTQVLNVVNRPQFKLVFDLGRITAYLAAYFLATRQHASLPEMVRYLAWFGTVSYVIYLGLILHGVASFKSPREQSTVEINR